MIRKLLHFRLKVIRCCGAALWVFRVLFTFLQVTLLNTQTIVKGKITSAGDGAEFTGGERGNYQSYCRWIRVLPMIFPV